MIILGERDGEWYFVGNLVYNGEYPGKDFVKPTHSEEQSYWRALRKLEKYGYVETKKKPTGIMHRFGDGRGGSSYCKLVRLTDKGRKEVNKLLSK